MAKRSNLTLGLIFFLTCFSTKLMAQHVLPEVTIVPSTYKYLDAVYNRELPQPVRMLEIEAAIFDVKKSEYYQDDYDTYYISFYIPEGQILASYDKEGNLLRTAEKFRNTRIPPNIAKALTLRFPRWTVSRDVYLVHYHEGEHVTKLYKVVLENGNKRMRIKVNDKGEIF